MLKFDKILRSELVSGLDFESDLINYLMPLIPSLDFDASLYSDELNRLYKALKLELFLNDFFENRKFLYPSGFNFPFNVNSVLKKLNLNFKSNFNQNSSKFTIELAFLRKNDFFEIPKLIAEMDHDFKKMFLTRLLLTDFDFIFSSQFCLTFFDLIQGVDFSEDYLAPFTSFFNDDSSFNYSSILFSQKTIEIFLSMHVASPATDVLYNDELILFLKFLNELWSHSINLTCFSDLQKFYASEIDNYTLNDVIEFVLRYNPKLLIHRKSDDDIFFRLHDSFLALISDHLKLRNSKIVLNWFKIFLQTASYDDETRSLFSKLFNDRVLANVALVQRVFLTFIFSLEESYLFDLVTLSTKTEEFSSARGIYKICKFIEKLYFLYLSGKFNDFKGVDFLDIDNSFSIEHLDSFFDSLLSYKLVQELGITDDSLVNSMLSIKSKLLNFYCFYTCSKLDSFKDILSQRLISELGGDSSGRDFDTSITRALPSDMMDNFLINTSFEFPDNITVSETDDFFHILNMGLEPKVTCYSCLDGTFRENILPVMFLQDRKYLRLTNSTKFYARAVLRFVTFHIDVLRTGVKSQEVVGLTIDNFSGRPSDLNYFMSFLCTKAFDCKLYIVVHVNFFTSLKPSLDTYNFNLHGSVKVDHKPENIFNLHYTDNCSLSQGGFMAIFLDSKKENQ